MENHILVLKLAKAKKKLNNPNTTVMSKQLSAEWQKKIEQEADEYREKTGCDTVGYYSTHRDRSAAYEAGATKYALKLIEAQERIKSLEYALNELRGTAYKEDFGGYDNYVITTCDNCLSPNTVNSKEDE